MSKQKVIVIVGPTAVGKSDCAVDIATHFNGEIISADSRQVYKGLDIGTGKISSKEMKGVPHYLLDVEDPKKTFSVSDFVPMAENAISFISCKGKIPIICGGTGFYIDTLIDKAIFPNVKADPKLRAQLEKSSLDILLAKLEKFDQKRASTIDRKNKRKIIRAIEIAENLGHVPEVITSKAYDTLFIGLNIDRDKLRSRIMERLLKRLDGGMIEEINRLHSDGLSWKRMEALGLEYRYVSRYVRGIMTKEEMIEKLHTEICRYAKRQMTWFRRNKKIEWFEPGETKRIRDVVAKFIGNPS